jgi:hypothetical protein
MNPWVRSVLAVVGGFAAMAVIVIAVTPLAMKAMRVEIARPTRSYMVVNLAYSFTAALAGGYLAALIAGRAPIGHGVALAVFMLVMSGVSAKQSWGQQPKWYVAVLSLGGPVFCMLGAWLRSTQM